MIAQGSKVKFLEDDGSWVYGQVEELGKKHPDSALVAIVQWDDGKKNQIYADHLKEV